MDRKYYYALKENTIGPLTYEELRAANIQRGTLIWFAGMNNWMRADEINELKDMVAHIPPPPPPQPTPPPPFRPPVVATPPGPRLVSKPLIGKISKALFYIILITCIAILLCDLPFGRSIRIFNDERLYSYFDSFEQYKEFLIIAVVSFVLQLFNGIVLYIFFYKSWNFNYQKQATTLSPTLAILFLFIPLFNIVWYFFIYIKFTSNFNKLIVHYNYPPGLQIPILVAIFVPISKVIHFFLIGAVWQRFPGTLLVYAIYISLLAVYTYKVINNINKIREMDYERAGSPS